MLINEGLNETPLTTSKEARYTFVPTIVIFRWTRLTIFHQMALA